MLVYDGIVHKRINSPDIDEPNKKKKYWRIDGNYYDLTQFDFLNKHPGGGEIMLLARDYSKDQTYAFESHHPNWRMVRKMIQRYKVDAPPEADSIVDAKSPRFCTEESFYSVFRDRVYKYIKKNGSGPSIEAMILFYCSVFGWFLNFW